MKPIPYIKPIGAEQATREFGLKARTAAVIRCRERAPDPISEEQPA